MENKDIENQTSKKNEFQQAKTELIGGLEKLSCKMSADIDLLGHYIQELTKNIDKLEKATSKHSKTLIWLTIIIAILTFIIALPIINIFILDY